MTRSVITVFVLMLLIIAVLLLSAQFRQDRVSAGTIIIDVTADGRVLAVHNNLPGYVLTNLSFAILKK